MSRWAHGRVAGEVVQELGGGDRHRLAPLGAVGELGVAALDHLRVVARAAAAATAARRSAAPHSTICCRKRVVVAHHAGVGRAERDRRSPPVRVARSTSRSHPSRARVRDAVGEHEPPLGVGVVDLDRRAVERADDVAGLDRAAAGKVLGRADDPEDADRQPRAPRARRRPRSPPRRRPCRTSSRSMLRAGLDRQPAGVERDRLADQRRASAPSRDARSVVVQADQPRLLPPSPARPRRTRPSRRRGSHPSSSVTHRHRRWRSASSGRRRRASGASGRWPGVLPRSRARFWALVTVAARRTGSAMSWWALRIRRSSRARRVRAACSGRTGRRAGACPRRARRRRRRRRGGGPPSTESLAPSSRARPSAIAAATRARSASNALARAEPDEDEPPILGVQQRQLLELAAAPRRTRAGPQGAAGQVVGDALAVEHADDDRVRAGLEWAGGGASTCTRREPSNAAAQPPITIEVRPRTRRATDPCPRP